MAIAAQFAHPQDAWNALGANWWMVIIDGWAHKWGLNAFDWTEMSAEEDQHGRTSDFLRTMHHYFNSADAWQARFPWTAARAEAINTMLRGGGHIDRLYTSYQPRTREHPQCDPYLAAHPRFECGRRLDTCFCHTAIVTAYKGGDGSTEHVRPMLKSAFHRFYLELGPKTYNCRGQPWHPRRCMRDILHPIAWLYAYLAELHPFSDANSRLRTQILQTSIVKAGGHPLLLPSNGWQIYTMRSYEELYRFLLGGHCAFEFALAHGQSPYIARSSRLNAGGFSPMTETISGHARAHYTGNENFAFSPRALDAVEAIQINTELYDHSEDRCRIEHVHALAASPSKPASHTRPNTSSSWRCDSWCAGHGSPWSQKCGWGSRACSACAQCSVEWDIEWE